MQTPHEFKLLDSSKLSEAEGLYQLGKTYLDFAMSPDQGIKCLQLAADLQHSGAQYDLAYHYLNGTGVPQNFFTALKYLALAAGYSSPDKPNDRRSGFVEAQYDLAVLYMKSKHPGLTSQHRALGPLWLQLAASSGHFLAQCELHAYYQPTWPQAAAAWRKMAELHPEMLFYPGNFNLRSVNVYLANEQLQLAKASTSSSSVASPTSIELSTPATTQTTGISPSIPPLTIPPIIIPPPENKMTDKKKNKKRKTPPSNGTSTQESGAIAPAVNPTLVPPVSSPSPTNLMGSVSPISYPLFPKSPQPTDKSLTSTSKTASSLGSPSSFFSSSPVAVENSQQTITKSTDELQQQPPTSTTSSPAGFALK